MLRLVAALIGAFAIASLSFGAASTATAAPLAARTSDAAGVRVVVTPKTLAPGATVWEFEVVMDTHIKLLSEDLVRASVLVDEAGHRITPTAWQGDAPGGHHRKGVLRFSPPAAMPKSVELQIDGVGGAKTRSFRWDLQ